MNTKYFWQLAYDMYINVIIVPVIRNHHHHHHHLVCNTRCRMNLLFSALLSLVNTFAHHRHHHGHNRHYQTHQHFITGNIVIVLLKVCSSVTSSSFSLQWCIVDCCHYMSSWSSSCLQWCVVDAHPPIIQLPTNNVI